MTLFLENFWTAGPKECGSWRLRLTNLSATTLRDFTLSLTTITRIIDRQEVQGARLLRRAANFHEFAPPEGLKLAPGASWDFEATALSRAPRHRNDAAKTAWVTWNGAHLPVQVGDLIQAAQLPAVPAPRLPPGRLTLPFALIPWPNQLQLEAGPPPIMLYASPGTGLAEQRLMLAVAALHGRLYPAAPQLFQLSAAPGGRALAFVQDASLPPEGYRLEFGARITLSASTESGRRYGLISLAQMLHGAFTEPVFRFPRGGFIQDAPRYGWRGCHLDVSRHFWSLAEVSRVVDLLAWQKMNLFHWHLSDDEGWRAQILAYPELTATGAHRSADTPAMLPQLGDGPARSGGFYSQDQMRALVAHAGSLGVEVMPEIELPGHAACVMAALPFLVDPGETADSYQPVQGYPNNAWNPGMPETFTVLEQIIDELCGIFPSRHFHIGGDEVAQNAWLQSPKARALMQREGLAGTLQLQSWFLTRIKAMLTARGRVLVGWNEVAQGGGVPPQDTVLMAWEQAQVGIDLAKQGYGVVMTPGQAYYLDMAQGSDWLENGAGWAGSVPPEQCYHTEAAGDFPAELRPLLLGIQACIWCEHFSNLHWFNDLVFPRLSAVAEAGWTEPTQKDWLRFAAQARLHPWL